ncbi:MAG TPA: hypothetical protein VKD71_04420, partial [Gemmataceae bacterium]|nr:hypothetical protein [Gemmataceae bacterium]
LIGQRFADHRPTMPLCEGVQIQRGSEVTKVVALGCFEARRKSLCANDILGQFRDGQRALPGWPSLSFFPELFLLTLQLGHIS